jgi:L-ascorbate metabolism protein UlaG (beta-lactamase superfamily)
MIIVLIILFILFAGVFLFMRQPQFGRAASGERLAKIERSPNYRDGQFLNLSPTPSLTEGASYTKVMREFFFGKSKRTAPAGALPSRKTDLFQLSPDDDVLVWFGHSSYFMQLNGKKILVDPVLSGHASPIKFTTKSFKGSDVYSVNDIPAIDYLFISHDHYDHLDHQTIRQLQPRVSKTITGLGVGAHLERWGYAPAAIIELDWHEKISLEQGFVVNTVPARHFSGRGFKRNRTLWLSFVLTTPTRKIFIGGDSGYDTHFKEVGNQYGPFDLAILENGQYNGYWKYIHMMPEEVVQAAEDLRAKKLLPVHWSKFSLSLHAWDEPILRVTAAAKKRGMSILHPMIGELVHLDGAEPSTPWWEDLK